MKTRFLLAAAAIVCAALAAQDTLKLERKYVVGEKDSYKYKLSLETGQGSVDVAMTQAQAVVKVYDNGDADIESSTSGLSVKFNGQDVPVPAPPNQKDTRRYTKQGVPVSLTQGGRGGMQGGMAFAQFLNVLADKPLTVGQTVPVEYTLPDEKTTVSGTVKLESLANGVAKLLSHMNVTMPQSTKPVKLVITSFVDAASSKLSKAEGTATDLPEQGPMSPKAVQFTIERQAQ